MILGLETIGWRQNKSYEILNFKMIKVFNTFSKRVEVFKPIDDVVKIYCCGVTVYDLCHLGHARSYIAWDILRRFLIYSHNKISQSHRAYT